MNNSITNNRFSNVGCLTTPSSSAYYFDNTSTTISKTSQHQPQQQQQQLNINSTFVNCSSTNIQTSPLFINSNTNSIGLSTYLQQNNNNNNNQLNISSPSTSFNNNASPLILQNNCQLLNLILSNNIAEFQQKLSLSDTNINNLPLISNNDKQNLTLKEQKFSKFIILFFFFINLIQ